MSRQDSKLRLKVIHTVESESLLDGVKSVLCCLSGGADSSVLLHVLSSLKKRYGFELTAVHVNHMIRGLEADRDEAFCKDMCERLGVKLTTVSVDVPRYAKEQKISLELAARKLRYEVFAKVMLSDGANVAATAHNADDNAETLLYNIIRGTSTTGIQAIPYKRDCFIRPLLAVSRMEIEEYAKENAISYVEDSTNSSDEYTRNFIRHNIIPLCKQLNPSFLSAVTRLTDSAKADEKLISSFDADNKRRIKKLLEENGISGVNNQTLFKIENAIKDGGTKEFTLSNGVKMAVVNGEPSFEKIHCENRNYQNEVLALGENVFFDGTVTVNCEPSTENFRGIYKTFTTVGFVSDIIFNDLRVRNRISGDTVTVGGVRKSLKKELINRKIPRNMRDLLPVFCVGDKVAFAPYVGVDDEFAPKSENSIKITVKVDL